MKNIETEIIINASPERVWQVLTDFEQHPQWNPFIKSISGTQKEGTFLNVRMQPPGSRSMTFKPEILAFQPNREFRWKGKLLFNGLFDGEHYFVLEKINGRKTKFIHGEDFSGILVGLFGGMLKNTKAGFEAMNVALKKTCEAR